jgi:hypothetical protein
MRQAQSKAEGEAVKCALRAEGEEMMRRLLCGVLVVTAAMVYVPTSAMAAFGLQRLAVAATNQNGSPDVQAGSHPYALTTTFILNNPSPIEAEVLPGEKRTFFVAEGDLKDVTAELPPGFVGDPDAMPRCSYQTFTSKNSSVHCPNETVVGVDTTYVTDYEGVKENFEEVFGTSDPIYNIEPPHGVAAEFGFKVAGISPVFLDVSVRTGGDYGLTVRTANISQAVLVYADKVTIWGVPAAPSHNALRGTCLNGVVEGYVGGLGEGEVERESPPAESNGECPVSAPEVPLLTNPTSCGVPRTATLGVDSWQEPGIFASKSVSLPELVGCEKLDFSPTISVGADGTAGSTPTGLNVDLHVPQEASSNPAGLAEADVKDTTVALPEGVQMSPSAADGLLACSPTQIGLHGGEPPSCPEASKVGTVEIDTPLLPEPLTGAVYLATQDENPFGSLVALYVVAEDPVAGVLVKVAGQVTPNPVTGQLVTTFENTPQLPFSDFKLSFFGTDRAPLTTPPLCGTYTTKTSIAPWSGTPAVDPSSKFQITSGPAGSPCASPRPFSPGFQAGSTNIQAGAFSPFTLTMSRPDGDQTLAGLSIQLPPGLAGSLSKVQLCPEPQASTGDCPVGSLIGHTVVSSGLGNDPFTVEGGQVFITGPYKGAPFGLSILNPAKAGPFNLGYVVVRAKIEVNPTTAALHIVSDPLPTIIDGIPLQIQHVNVTIDKPEFTFNPTNCTPMQLTGAMTSTEGASASVGTPFQVTNCAALAFKPGFAVSTSGKPSRANGASLDVKLTYPSEPAGTQANIAKVKVELPKQLPSRLTTLQKACPEATFDANPASCPSASKIGEAVATTPILAGGLAGPAYFVSHGGAKFPELIVVLEGEDGVTVDLHGETFISKKGITSSTFATVPDVPVGSFELKLPQGPYSALAANGNLCKSKLTMPTEFVAQNGATIHQSTEIQVTGCPKAKEVTKKKRRQSRTNKKARKKSRGGQSKSA